MIGKLSDGSALKIQLPKVWLAKVKFATWIVSLATNPDAAME